MTQETPNGLSATPVRLLVVVGHRALVGPLVGRAVARLLGVVLVGLSVSGVPMGPGPAAAEAGKVSEKAAGGGAKGEAHAFQVEEPSGYRMEHYRSPVPETLKGARVIGVPEAEDLWRAGEAVFVDVYPQAPKPPGLPKSTVWRTPKHESIEGAEWLANVGYGKISDDLRAFMVRELERLTGSDRTKTVVFFCLRDCWMSWNAAKRALELGYTDVVWFPEGTDGWRDFSLPTTMLTPVPMS